MPPSRRPCAWASPQELIPVATLVQTVPLAGINDIRLISVSPVESNSVGVYVYNAQASPDNAEFIFMATGR